MVAVAVVLAGDVAGERVAAVGPPEAGAVVGVERQDLLGQGHGAEGLHGQVAVEHVALLGGVFEEEAVAARLVADAIANQQVVGAVDRDPAVVRIPDAGAEHAAAAHRVAHEVEVDRILAEHALLAEVPELGVADAARRAAVIHRVAAHAGGIGRLDDDVAREVGDLAAHQLLAAMRLFEGTIEREHRAVDGRDRALLRAHRLLPGERPLLRKVCPGLRALATRRS